MNLASLFHEPNNLKSALVHRSYCNEHPGISSNERLEFLGDAILSFVISHRLYRLLPDITEGELTNRRSYLVQTSTLSQKALSLGLDKMLLLSRGEEDLGGRTNPSLLANTFEAVLGALYLDSGIAACRQFLAHVFPDSSLLQTSQTKDPKSLLQEKSQSLGWRTPVYQLGHSSGPDHARLFTVSVSLNGQV